MMLMQAIFANHFMKKMKKDNTYSCDQEKYEFYRKMAQLYQVNHEVLNLLTSLSQVCCHAGVIRQKEKEDFDLIAQIENLKLNGGDENDVVNRWSEENIAFDMQGPSSKIKKMMEVLNDQVLQSNNKAVIASQYTSFLNIISGFLENKGVSGTCQSLYSELALPSLPSDALLRARRSATKLLWSCG